jgi:hypothetical protein
VSILLFPTLALAAYILLNKLGNLPVHHSVLGHTQVHALPRQSKDKTRKRQKGLTHTPSGHSNVHGLASDFSNPSHWRMWT